MNDNRYSEGGDAEPGEFRLLCVGDIHLGRRPSRVPKDIEDYGIREAELTPAAAWHSAVAWAIDNDIDAVVLAGDVVESLDDRFEAYGHLERGVSKLDYAEIGIYGVAGNHDVHALPRLADHIKNFKLLGRGGAWESIELTGRSGVRLRLLGWSFPQQRVSRNPLDDPMEAFSDDIPTIGVLHCDLDGGSSPYAPVPRAAFDRALGAAWLLGHIHKPDDLSATRPIGYLGSLVGLDPGESGLHGPWLARISKTGAVMLDQLSIAPLRYERIDLCVETIPDLDGDDLEDAFAAALRSAMEDVHNRIAPTLGRTRLVGCRITLTGRSSLHDRIRRILSDTAVQDGHKSDYGGVVYFVEKIIDHSRPALDLVQIAKGSDPPALLAQRLLCLQEGQAEAEELVEAAAMKIEKATETVLGAVMPITQPLSTSEINRLLQYAGFEALEELLAQHSTYEGPPE